ncbi:MAG: hypothetical protein L6R42_005803 [Xanthoria sp. 1 TBL-2021]|nr:MAG: hypothetical protein L6R42_005803 [Xanthoria sp. 1 TBL-2021]
MIASTKRITAMEQDSENAYASRLPQLQSKIRMPSPVKGTFGELSASSMNARNAAMPPPAKTGTKRKTLAELGGEPRRAPQAPSINGTTIAGTKPSSWNGNYRQLSSSSSVTSSRPSSVASSRNISGGSFAATLSTASRPPSAQNHRPQSAMAASKIQRPHSTQESLEIEWASSIVASGSSRSFSLSTTMNDLSLEESRSPTTPKVAQKRETSISTGMWNMSLSSHKPHPIPPTMDPITPSQIPKLAPKAPVMSASACSPSKSPKKAPASGPRFLNRNTNTTVTEEFDVGDRLERMESVMSDFKSKFTGAATESDGLRETIGIYKARVMELETTKTHLEAKFDTLNADICTTKAELRSCKSELTASSHALEDLKRSNKIQVDDLQRQHKRELEESRRQGQEEIFQSERKHTTEREDLKRKLELALEEERAHHRQELQTVTSVKAKSQEQVEAELERQRRQQECLEEELRKSRADLACERSLNSDLRTKVSESASTTISLESSIRSLRAHVEFLESDNKSQSNAFSDLDNRLQNAIKAAEEAKEKLRTEETLRRKLHNQVQELKGNIRVFCRVRPSLESDPNDASARINYPDGASDSKEVEVLGPEEKNSLGKISTKTNAFAFDRVFSPGSANADVFGEISQLVQSALDGYNVCIFCYGQTGSGKTFTMSAQDGMIPRAVNQIYDTAKSLEEKGWKYTMEGSFIEVYNENINDLLGKPDELDKKKHEIRHDMQKCKTTITGITTVDLDSPNKVESVLQSAASNRSVAATKANERSSRSHSVFILKLTGENSTTGEKSEGTLNLVDLAGSERLSHSQAAGERLKETQSINKSLSCLGDVIGALGQGKDGGHVPYRNSKLTYLLQFSLGGNSKTLMFVMISPLQAHLNETLTSLKFATKVHNTHIGTAKRQAKIRDA